MTSETDPPYMAWLLTMIDDLRQQNVTLQDNVQVLQLQSQGDGELDDAILEPKPLSQEIWEDQVHDNFRLKIKWR